MRLAVLAVKLPEASRFTIVEAVLASVALFARMVAVLTEVALDPPTEATVAATDPEPDAVTSPVKAEIPEPATPSDAQLVPLQNCILPAL